MSSILDPGRLTDDKINEFTEANDPRVIVAHFMSELQTLTFRRSGQGDHHDVTPQASKDIYETIGLIRQVIQHREQEEGKSEDQMVRFTYEDSDVPTATETISAEITRREPGSFSEGPPFRGDVKNMRPILREMIEDPENPGYRQAIMGYFFDNIITLTCWGQTNKAVNERSLWLERLMFDYLWYFRYCGVNKILYYGRDRDVVREPSQNNLYGRRIKYYVRTELISTISEKTLTRILINADGDYLTSTE